MSFARGVRLGRPGRLTAVLAATGALVLGSAVLTANSVADHLQQAVIDQAIRSADVVARAHIDPLVNAQALAGPGSPAGDAVNRELEGLVGVGGLLRIKIWSPDGTVRFSDLPALRGSRFPVGAELRDALAGDNSSELNASPGGENVHERGLASQLFEIYLPIRLVGSQEVVAAYELYEDASPLVSQIEATRRTVFLISGGAGLGFALLLTLAFAGSARRLKLQNRLLRSMTAELGQSEARFRSLVQNSSDSFLVLEADGVIRYESVAVDRILGYRPEQRTGRSFLELVQPADREYAARLLTDLAGTPGAERAAELRVQHADGRWRTLEWVGKNLLAGPAVAGIVVNYRDITERKALEAQLTRQTFQDPLTGLPNRALLVDRLAHALNRGHGQLTAVLFVDLDDFTTVNNGLGHAAGDQLLVQVGERLRQSVRPADTVARMGGDEFAVLVEQVVDARVAAKTADRLVRALRRPFSVDDREVRLSASIGLAVGDARQTVEELLRNADLAMYVAMTRGKGGFETFTPTMYRAAVARLELKADLHHGLERGEFVLHYQPIVRIATGQVAGVEALVRWQHPERGLVAPGEFIPLAEETRLIVPLGRWVLSEACRQARSWADAHPETDDWLISVNLSPIQLEDPGLADDVAGELHANGIPPRRLVLEVTESTLAADGITVTGNLRTLRRLGVRLAVDDFGTGYSSLTTLQHLPVNIIKIDRSIVVALDQGPKEVAFLRSVVELGHRLGAEVVAEGIELDAQLAELKRLGAEFGQGFHLARPMDPGQLAMFLKGAACFRDGAAEPSDLHVGQPADLPGLPGLVPVEVPVGDPATAAARRSRS